MAMAEVQEKEERLRTIQSELRTKAGVDPSQHWLTDCLDALFSQIPKTGELTDECLYQILHHDLRDVIRTFDDDGVGGGEGGGGQSTSSDRQRLPSVRLRKAVQDSTREESNCKAELMAPFRLLVQIEEFLDVSRNATTRLEVGPASPDAPAPTGNQSNRCLKLAFSDGYHPLTGLSRYRHEDEENQNSNTSQHRQASGLFVAMEVAAISQMSSNSRAGLKVLLTGPITVRHGVLLLHPGNAIVLGGHVPELFKFQREALEQAKRLAGVGVDPTIRALIGTTATQADEEDDDRASQGEHESRDLEPVPVPSIATTTSTAAPVNNSTSYQRSSSSAGNASLPVRTNAYQPQFDATPTRPPPVPNTLVPSTSVVSSVNMSNRTLTPPGPPKLSPVPMDVRMIDVDRDDASTMATMANNTATSSSLASQRNRHNPYSTRVQQGNRSSSDNIHNNINNNSGSAHISQTTTSTGHLTPLPSNPYSTTARSVNGSSQEQPPIAHNDESGGSARRNHNPYSSRTTNKTTTTTTRAPISGVSSSSTSLSVAETRTVSSLPQHLQQSSTATTAKTTTTTAVIDITTPTAAQRPLVLLFEELRILMVRIRDNPALHQQYLGRTFVSPLRQVGPRVEFNIVKVKTVTSGSGGKKKDKQYEYLLICKFGGENTSTTNIPNETDSSPPLLLTCQVSSALQEPYFKLPPKEMRDLSKTNRAEAQLKVKQGGEGIAMELARCSPYELTLLQVQDVPPTVDGSKPILLLTKKHLSSDAFF